MKRFFTALAIFAAIFSSLLLVQASGSFKLRAVWVASVYNLDYPSKPGLSAEALKREADEIIENAAAWGLNAIFLQVRPSADSLFDSDIFPWSAYLSGEQGAPPDGGFDPLAYFIERAHGLEIEIHAWINPYRITRASQPTRELAFAQLSPDHPAWSMPEAVVHHTDGCLYFNPGMPEARALIVSGVMEVAAKYDVDGIHMDDYFYPGSSFDDAEAYALYGGGFAKVEDFRRASVTQLIQTLHSRLGLLERHVEFGISPFGIWANVTQRLDGSATRGDSSYYSHFADTRAWVMDGIIDYIMPQLYWHIGSAEGEFATLLNWWDSVVRGTGVELYVGLAAYRLLEAKPGGAWYGTDEIAAQLELMQSSSASGVGFYRYRSVADNEALATFLSEYFAQPPEKYYMPYPLPVSTPASFIPESGAVRMGVPSGFWYSAPPGSSVTVMLGDTAATLYESAGGRFYGEAAIEPDGEPYRDIFPLVINESNGFVRVEIVPEKITAVQTGEPVSITRIALEDTEPEHRITFYTAQPAVASCSVQGTSIRLIIAPCRMAVLFEDSFFESIDFTLQGDVGVYTLILPVGAGSGNCRVDWKPDSISLIIGQAP